jgi:hypothetical protein
MHGLACSGQQSWRLRVLIAYRHAMMFKKKKNLQDGSSFLFIIIKILFVELFYY